MRKTRPALSIVSAIAIVVMSATFSLYGAPDMSGALVQRLTFAVFFAWYIAAALISARGART